MKIGYFPDLKAIVRSSSLRPAVVRRGYGVKLAPRNGSDGKPLIIDENTQKDLELFAAQSAAAGGLCAPGCFWARREPFEVKIELGLF